MVPSSMEFYSVAEWMMVGRHIAGEAGLQDKGCAVSGPQHHIMGFCPAWEKDSISFKPGL